MVGPSEAPFTSCGPGGQGFGDEPIGCAKLLFDTVLILPTGRGYGADFGRNPSVNEPMSQIAWAEGTGNLEASVGAFMLPWVRYGLHPVRIVLVVRIFL